MTQACQRPCSSSPLPAVALDRPLACMFGGLEGFGERFGFVQRLHLILQDRYVMPLGSAFRGGLLGWRAAGDQHTAKHCQHGPTYRLSHRNPFLVCHDVIYTGNDIAGSRRVISRGASCLPYASICLSRVYRTETSETGGVGTSLWGFVAFFRVWPIWGESARAVAEIRRPARRTGTSGGI
jgi:hypothetical protein